MNEPKTIQHPAAEVINVFTDIEEGIRNMGRYDLTKLTLNETFMLGAFYQFVNDNTPDIDENTELETVMFDIPEWLNDVFAINERLQK